MVRRHSDRHRRRGRSGALSLNTATTNGTCLRVQGISASPPVPCPCDNFLYGFKGTPSGRARPFRPGPIPCRTAMRCGSS